jgi:hypothetical protein
MAGVLITTIMHSGVSVRKFAIITLSALLIASQAIAGNPVNFDSASMAKTILNIHNSSPVKNDGAVIVYGGQDVSRVQLSQASQLADTVLAG